MGHKHMLFKKITVDMNSEVAFKWSLIIINCWENNLLCTNIYLLGRSGLFVSLSAPVIQYLFLYSHKLYLTFTDIQFVWEYCLGKKYYTK